MIRYALSLTVICTPAGKPGPDCRILRRRAEATQRKYLVPRRFVAQQSTPSSHSRVLSFYAGSGTRSFGRGFGFGGGGFAKSVKLSACDVAIHNFEVNYAKNSLKCTMKFEVTQVGAGANYYGDESDY